MSQVKPGAIDMTGTLNITFFVLFWLAHTIVPLDAIEITITVIDGVDQPLVVERLPNGFRSTASEDQAKMRMAPLFVEIDKSVVKFGPKDGRRQLDLSVLYHRGSGPAAANDYSWLLCRKKGTQDCVESYEVTRSQLTVHVRSNQQKGFVVTWKTADSKAK